MSLKTLTTLSFLLLLPACATQQQSPIYEHNTSYGTTTQNAPHTGNPHVVSEHVQTNAPVTYAGMNSQPNTAPVTDTAPVKYGTIASAPNTNSDFYHDAYRYDNCDHVCENHPENAATPFIAPPAPSMTLANNDPNVAPTDSVYGDTFGTPGYHAMQANGDLDASVSTSNPTMSPTTAQAANVDTALTAPTNSPALVPIPAPQDFKYNSPVTGGAVLTNGIILHTIVEGDTVYSLSRKQCVSVEELQELNNIDANFYIRLDDQIKLPASRC